MLTKIINYLNLHHIGGLELFFASLMILSAYSYKGIPLQVILWGMMFVILFFKQNIRYVSVFKPLMLLTIFVLIHDFIYLFIAKGNMNAYIMQIIYFCCIFMAVKVFDIEKLKGSLNLVVIISMAGLLYQVGIIAAGGEIHPLELPFLEMSKNRLDTFSVRPSSFFMEPAAYAAFMYIPLQFSLIDKKYIWTTAIIFFNLLTTSTTGVFTVFIILIVYLFTQRIHIIRRFFIVILGATLLLVYTNVELFQVGLQKILDVDAETNIRLSQGPYVVSTMESWEMVAGAPYHNAYYYCLTGRAPKVVFYNQEVYMSTFWMLILKYGVIGLFLYIWFYYKIARYRKETIPLVVCLFATMFSSTYGLGLFFVYLSIPLLMMYYCNLEHKKYA